MVFKLTIKAHPNWSYCANYTAVFDDLQTLIRYP